MKRSIDVYKESKKEWKREREIEREREERRRERERNKISTYLHPNQPNLDTLV